jgi:DNA polymerase-3 subunit epsilon
MKFAALDFETANRSDASICAAGVAVFENGELKESLYWLIRPPKGHGWFREDFTRNCHGLTWFDVQHAPEFPAIAPELLHRLTTADFVIAHNAPFDLRKLRGTLSHFGWECPSFDCRCTLQLAKKAWPELPSHGLGALAKYIGHEFRHHNAQADAEAAGWVMLDLFARKRSYS